MTANQSRKERAALLPAIVAGFAIVAYLNWVGAQAQGKVDAALAALGSRKTVVVAARSISVGRRITAADVRRRWIIGRDAEPGAVRSSAAVIGAAATQEIFKGEQILASHLAGKGSHRASAALAPGKTAVAIAVGDIAAAPAAISPGDRVDVFGFNSDGNYGRSLRDLLVKGIGGLAPFSSRRSATKRDEGGVLAGGTMSEMQEGQLILEVEPWQAAALSSMAEAGKVRVALRASVSATGGDD